MSNSDERNRDPQFPFFEEEGPAPERAARSRRSKRASRRDSLSLNGGELAAQGYDYDPLAMDDYDLPPEQSLLRNPYVLAGLAVAGAIVLAVMVVVLFGGGSNGGATGEETRSSDNNGGVVVDPLTPQPGRGVMARSVAAATIREGPAIEFPEIAPLRANQDVEVAGRNQAGSWFQIYYPFGSQLKAWVAASALKLPDGSTEKLAVVVATPIPRPTIALPTGTPEPAATAVPTATPVPTPQAGPDLELKLATSICQPGVPMAVSLRNAGQSKIENRRIRLTVVAASGAQNIADNVISLEPGASVTLNAGPVTPPRTGARVDFIDGGPSDSNPGNNLAECVIGGPAPGASPFPGFLPPTPLPTRAGP